MPIARTHVAFSVERATSSPDWQSIAGWINQHATASPAVVRDAAEIVGIHVPAYLSIDTATHDPVEAIREARQAVEGAAKALGIKDFSWEGITAIPILISVA